MINTIPTKSIEKSHPIIKTLPKEFLNCYEILNSSTLSWDVTTCLVERLDGQKQSHEDRGKIKNVIWELRKKYKGCCTGYGFVIDVDEKTVAIPSNWNLPSPAEIIGYRVTRRQTFATKMSEPKHQNIIAGIVREALKYYFKNKYSKELGFLWQDFDQFCQMPDDASDKPYLFCRRFGFSIHVLRNHRWVLELIISTCVLDGRTFEDYYIRGEISKLGYMIQAKQRDRLTRENRPPSVRVWGKTGSSGTALDLEDPNIIINQGKLSSQEQKSLAAQEVRCRRYPNSLHNIPTSQIRLILDAGITQEEHSETIIEPEDRYKLMKQVRDFVDGIDVYGKQLKLEEKPFDIDELRSMVIMPPSVRVKNKHGGESIIESPKFPLKIGLRERNKNLSRHIQQNGYLQQRPINPLLAFPKYAGEQRAKRIKNDFEYIWRSQGINFRFEWTLFKDVEDIRRTIEHKKCDALLAVLPEKSQGSSLSDNIHEEIKKRVEVPSQCIQLINTLPEKWVDKKPNELQQIQSNLYKRIMQNYSTCLGNLLVKHHWIPFAPAEPFYFNTHVGIDVGGQHNNYAMACLGHGFRKPQEGLIFRPEEIYVNLKKVEPIPQGYLYKGLLRLFEEVYIQFKELSLKPDFEYSVFYRDGALLGDGDKWNERDDLLKLHAELLRRGWITGDSIWTAVEVLKRAEGWRVFRGHEFDKVGNPLVGRCIFSFDNDDTCLVCTTGDPYLTQGTASPLMIRISDIYGSAERVEVIRDVVWQADMCFTKLDIGMSFPWVLHVADTGALQASKSYYITGITV